MAAAVAQIPEAKTIGGIIRDARLEKGFKSRSSLVETRRLKSKLTQEGLRKIEHGERVPRLENIRLLAETLGIPERRIKEMERLAIQANIQRVTRRAGNVPVEFEIQGKAVRVTPLPPHRKTEAFVRDVVQDLIGVVEKYGVMQADVDHFRRNARHILLRRLST